MLARRLVARSIAVAARMTHPPRVGRRRTRRCSRMLVRGRIATRTMMLPVLLRVVERIIRLHFALHSQGKYDCNYKI